MPVAGVRCTGPHRRGAGRQPYRHRAPASAAGCRPDAAYIVGTWDSEPITIAIEGVGQGTLVGTTTYKADRSLTLFGTVDTPTAYGVLRQTITGQGTYTATAFGEDSIQITPNVSLVTYSEGQVPVTSKLTTPYIAKIIDQNTVQDKDGNLSRRR